MPLKLFPRSEGYETGGRFSTVCPTEVAASSQAQSFRHFATQHQPRCNREQPTVGGRGPGHNEAQIHQPVEERRQSRGGAQD